MSITFVVIILILLLILTSYFGIYFSRKQNFLKDISSTRNTLVLIGILIIIVFIIQLKLGQDMFYSIGFALGFILPLPFLMGLLGIITMKIFSKNYLATKKDYWSSCFFSLIWSFLSLILFI